MYKGGNHLQNKGLFSQMLKKSVLCPAPLDVDLTKNSKIIFTRS